ncbi:transporter [Rhizobium rhizosphaerae]|uniref:Transporter n=1 Tax=Xaviernesmea rhizosphaerae TaxID=1672749 RepID=A0A1Q9AIE6_9HYPH|nr:DUF6691 family protein [Xaviernesmea rhizosphaerae]OLP55026.1 transporter [Xaviernesmea rhizosphaerae]
MSPSRLLSALACGLLFGAGLVISDMANPQRVLAFLDIAGAWDPSLAFVMAGALVPSSLAYWIKRRQARPLLDKEFHIPTSRTIDGRLVGGAVLFGLGWGLVGLCPGPAFAVLITGRWQAALFVGAMLTGMLVFRLVRQSR